MTSIARILRQIELVCQSWKNIVVGVFVDHRHIEVFLRNFEMSSS
jgi:hypothetical protein